MTSPQPQPRPKEMSPEEQRIAIAEACGWLEVQRCSRRLNSHPEGSCLMGTKDGPTINYSRTFELIPDYTADLNAMHEATKALDVDARIRFLKALSEIVYRDYNANTSDESQGYMEFATAPQRAEAFLRTLNLWKP